MDKPALTGSEKQIKWAGDIRRRFVEDATRDIDRLARPQDLQYVPILKAALAAIVSERVAAKQWIDARGESPGRTVGERAAQMQTTNK